VSSAIIDDISNDVRYGARTLVRSPGFTIVAVLTLTLGIGATTAIFSVVNTVLLRPLPYHDPQRLVSFFEDLGRLGYPRTRISPTTYVDLRDQTQIFEDVAVVNETGFNLNRSGSARQLAGVLATHNLFAVLGVNPIIGTAFSPEEDQPGRDHVLLLSYSFWRDEFAGSAGVVGQTIRLNGEPYIVKGVMPSSFSFPDNEPNAIDVWVPRAFTAQELNTRRSRYLFSVGRLRSGISLDTANAALRVLELRNARQYPTDMQGVSRFFAEPLQESYTHGAKAGLLMLAAAVGFIVLIACANVANLLFSRAAGRRREMTLRAALGAGSGRIVRQLLTESALLCAIGAATGTFIAVACFALLKHMIPENLSRTAVLTFKLAGIWRDHPGDLGQQHSVWFGARAGSLEDRLERSFTGRGARKHGCTAKFGQRIRCRRNSAFAGAVDLRRSPAQERFEAGTSEYWIPNRSRADLGFRLGGAEISRLGRADPLCRSHVSGRQGIARCRERWNVRRSAVRF